MYCLEIKRPLAGHVIPAHLTLLRMYGLGQDDAGVDDFTFDYTPPIPTVDEPMNISNTLTAPSDLTLTPSGTYTPSALLTPTGSLTPAPASATASIINAAGQSAAALTKAITSPGGPTLYPAPAGGVLPAGAIGWNAYGQPINAAGQVVASSILSTLSQYWYIPLAIAGVFLIAELRSK